jgi:hypothetical protein
MGRPTVPRLAKPGAKRRVSVCANGDQPPARRSSTSKQQDVPATHTSLESAGDEVGEPAGESALTERQRRFVELFMGECAGNATQAALRAGYGKDAKSAAVRGHELLRNRKIQTGIQARQGADPRIATREERQLLLTQMMNDGKRPDSIRLQALQLLAKSQGDFVEKQDIRSETIYRLSWDEDEPQTPARRRSKRSVSRPA